MWRRSLLFLIGSSLRVGSETEAATSRVVPATPARELLPPHARLAFLEQEHPDYFKREQGEGAGNERPRWYTVRIVSAALER
jgi:hypothetical protein